MNNFMKKNQTYKNLKNEYVGSVISLGELNE